MSDHAQQDSAAETHDEHGEEHHSSTATYMAVFAALCILTLGSFLTTSAPWKAVVPDHVSWAIMMTVSCCKAMLVILFFMHLKHEANWKYVLTIPAGFMSIFLVLMLVPDVGWRTDNYSSERWHESAQPAVSAPADHDHDQEHEPADDSQHPKH